MRFITEEQTKIGILSDAYLVVGITSHYDSVYEAAAHGCAAGALYSITELIEAGAL